MSTSTPILSRLAVVQVGGTAIGFLTDFTTDIKAEVIKEYVCQTSANTGFFGQRQPNQHIQGFSTLCPITYAALLNDVLNGTVVTVIWGPQGTTTGNPKITYNNVILTAYSVKNGQKGTIANDISGEAQTITPGSF